MERGGHPATATALVLRFNDMRRSLKGPGRWHRDSSLRWLALIGCAVFVTASAVPAMAQTDSAAGLGRPPAPGGEAPVAVPGAPPAAEAPPGYRVEPAPSATPPAEVPPPPEARGYGRPQGYPSGRGQGVDGPDLRVPSRIATRLRVLDADFAYLAARGGSRIVDGILSIVTGGLSITLGIIIDEPNLSEYLYVYGGAGVARGVVDLVLNPNASSAAIDYSHRPMGTMAEVQERLQFGESELESLADTSRLSRILSASINIAAGAAFVPVYLGPNDFEVDTFGAIVLVTAGVSVVTGIINLFTRSEAERRWSAYEELRERLAGRGEDAEADDRAALNRSRPTADFDRVDFGVAATPLGATVGLTGRF